MPEITHESMRALLREERQEWNDRFDDLQKDLRDGLGSVNTQLSIQNGRVRALEIRQAIDGERVEQLSKERSGPTSAYWGAGAGAFAIGVVEAFKAYWNK